MPLRIRKTALLAAVALMGAPCYAQEEYEDAEEAVMVATLTTVNQEAAAAGDAAAQFQLARCYFTGSGIAQSTTKGMEWLRKAADQGYAEAQCQLAECYIQGNGVSKNADKPAAGG